jgi:putative iron-regulated protein
MMVAHLDGLAKEWKPNVPDNYRSRFMKTDQQENIRRILTGMIILAGFETGGERVQAALTSGDKEDEHSCFSDNTHRDMIQDVQGIINVFTGRYGDVSGPGIKDLLAITDNEMANTIEQKLKETHAAAMALPVPFDQAIILTNTEGRAKVTTLVSALRGTARALEVVFTRYGLELRDAE